MKKSITAILLACLCLFAGHGAVRAAEESDGAGVSAVMAVNSSAAFFNGVYREINPPLLVFGKTYVDLQEMTNIFNIPLTWVDDYTGYFQADLPAQTVNFRPIGQYDDLLNYGNRFFKKDGRFFISLRELVDCLGSPVAYENGLITVGVGAGGYGETYGSISTAPSDTYVYESYPCWAEYVVNPLQTYSYETMLSDAAKLQHMYPELIRTSSIGQSVEGRELLLVELGRGKNKIFVCGTHHAREYIATTYLMYAVDRYAFAYRNYSKWGIYNVREILDNVTFCIVPMVNPDGVNLVQNGLYATQSPNEVAAMGFYDGTKYGYASWKANVHGVDVNWNYDKDWYKGRNKNGRGSSGFNGDYPNSEPETQAVAAYVDSYPFEAFLSFHTQGKIFYWADDVNRPTYLQNLIAGDTGFVGHREEATGVGGSFFDYVYRKYGKATITLELCPYIGNYPYPDQDFYTVWNPAKNVLMLVGNEIIYLNH